MSVVRVDWRSGSIKKTTNGEMWRIKKNVQGMNRREKGEKEQRKALKTWRKKTHNSKQDREREKKSQKQQKGAENIKAMRYGENRKCGCK